MKPLTRLERRALGLARRKGGVPVSGPRAQQDGTRRIPEGHVNPQIANALVTAGYALKSKKLLFITTAGRKAFNAPLPEGPPVFLAAGGGIKYRTLPSGRQVEDREGDDPLADHGYTTSRHRAADDLETMDSSLLHPDWRNRAEAHRKLSRADLDAARLSGLDHPEERLRELRLMAAERGMDVKDELRYVAHSLRILERKVRKEAA